MAEAYKPKKVADEALREIREIVDCIHTKGKEQTLKTLKKRLLNAFTDALLKDIDINGVRRELSDLVDKELKRLDRASDKYEIFLKARFWLEDEVILVIKRADAEKLIELRNEGMVLSQRDFVLQSSNENILGDSISVSIDFKKAFREEVRNEDQTDAENNTERYTSLVVQALFVVYGDKNNIWLSLHDRSYSGAEDTHSRYSLITGRLNINDLGARTAKVDTVCKEQALKRELTEIDEINLSNHDAQTLLTHSFTPIARTVNRCEFVGAYQDSKKHLLSFLYVIFVTAEEFNQLTNRGPYLLPVTPREFAKLKALDLVGDIVKTNSCGNCGMVMTDRRLEICKNCGKSPACNANCDLQPCILKDVCVCINKVTSALATKKVYMPVPDSNLEKYRARLTRNTTIIAIDIPNYVLGDTKRRNATKEQIERLLLNALPMQYALPGGYHYHLYPTSRGYTLILKKPVDSTPAANDIKLALVAYFLSLYLAVSFTHAIAPAFSEQASKQKVLHVRIALHACDIEKSASLTGQTNFFGNGLIEALQIVDLGREQQILCSQNFALQFLAELQSLEPFESDIIERSKDKNSITYLKRVSQASEFIKPETLFTLLEALGFSPIVALDICKDNCIASCYKDYGLPIQDLGFFTDDNGGRHRLFNLGIFPLPDQGANAEAKAQKRREFAYGNTQQPSARIPVVYRSATTTRHELDELVSSFRYTRYVTTYGYSNVRLLREIYKEYVAKEKDSTGLPALQSFKIVFYEYEQYRNINERKPQEITRADWFRGMFYAAKIAEAFPTKVQIAINKMHYGFNLFKIAYDNTAPPKYKDHLRLTVPIPGDAFEVSPVFIANRGDPLYNRFLEICERYIEQGMRENDDSISLLEIGVDELGFLVPDVESLTKMHVASADYKPDLLRQAPDVKPLLVQVAGLESDYYEGARLWSCIQQLDDYEAQYKQLLKI